jgi:hypothetical protein
VRKSATFAERKATMLEFNSQPVAHELFNPEPAATV